MDRISYLQLVCSNTEILGTVCCLSLVQLLGGKVEGTLLVSRVQRGLECQSAAMLHSAISCIEPGTGGADRSHCITCTYLKVS